MLTAVFLEMVRWISRWIGCLPVDDEQDNLEQVVPDQGSSERPKASTRLEALASLQARMIRHAMQCASA